MFSSKLISIVGLSMGLLSQVKGAQMNDAGIALLESFEGYEPNFYNDPTGIQTICYGYNCQANDCSGLSPPLSQQQCTDLLKQTLGTYEACACAMPGMAAANSNQYSALVDFAYNAGCGSLQETFPGAVSSGNFDGIADVLPNTNTLGGLEGLVRRRNAEADLMRTPTDQPSGC